MSKLENVRLAEFKEFNFEEKYSIYRQIIGIDKSGQLTTKDYTNWKNGISEYYSNIDTDSQERFVWAIKSSLNFISNARDSLFSILTPVLLLLIPVIVTYLMSVLPEINLSLIHPYLCFALYVIYSVFCMCICLVNARNSSIEKQFYESILDIVEK